VQLAGSLSCMSKALPKDGSAFGLSRGCYQGPARGPGQGRISARKTTRRLSAARVARCDGRYRANASAKRGRRIRSELPIFPALSRRQTA